MIVELNENDLRAIRKVLSCINEDTDEYDDADLGIDVDPEEYHKQKSKQSTLKSKVIEAWKAWARRLGSNIKPLRPMKGVYRSGGYKEAELISCYYRITGKSFQHSNEIDESTFFECILSSANPSFIDRHRDQLPGIDLAESIMDIYSKAYDAVGDSWYDSFVSAARVGELANEYLKFVKMEHPDMYSTRAFTTEDEKFIEMLHKCICNAIENNVDRTYEIIAVAGYLLAMTAEQRRTLYESFVSCVTQAQMFRVLDVYYAAPENELKLKRKYFNLAGRKKIDKQKFDFLKQNGTVEGLSKQASVDLKNPGKSWSWKSDNWEGNCSLVAKNDRENIDMTMSALCLGFWSTVGPEFKEFRGEREIRVIDETKVNVINVEFKE